MQSKSSVGQLTRAEQETQNEAKRLTAQIEDALAAVALRASSGIEDLEACADRLERAARDLSVALRELARERRAAQQEEK
jgi:prefoldin subunit 5